MSSDTAAGGGSGGLGGARVPNRALAGWIGPAWGHQAIADAARLGSSVEAGTRPALADWERHYAASVLVVDLGAIVLAVAVGARLGFGNNDYPHTVGLLAVTSALMSLIALLLCHAWEPRMLGQGSEEFSRVVRALAASSVVLGLGGLAFTIPSVRPWVFGIIPAAAFLAVLGRYVLRRGLHARRTRGRCLHKVLAVGTPESVSNLVSSTRRCPHHGWVVAGVCTPTGGAGHGEPVIAEVPVVGDLDDVAKQVVANGYRVVAVSPAPGWTPTRLQQLAWDLEGTGAELVVDPGFMEVAGPRLHVAPVEGLALLRLTEPSFTGVPRVVKAVFDRLGAALIVLLLAPLLLAIAVAVKLDGGPVFFRQTRVGRNGRQFRMIKFRSMVPGAEHLQAELEANDGAGPLFKLRRDPRVTRPGAWLRKYSLDELPQVFNVLAGSMSLVGPRPPLSDEVESFSRAAMRRLLVKPGLTGLWQVSGRSDLSWEESVRLDLRYVENWSLALDGLILWKTVGAVVGGRGAY